MRGRIGAPLIARLGAFAGSLAMVGLLLAAVEPRLAQMSVAAEVWLRFDSVGHGHGLAVALGFAAAMVLVGGVLGVGGVRLAGVIRGAVALLLGAAVRPHDGTDAIAADDTARLPMGEPRPHGARGPRAPGRSVCRPPRWVLPAS